LCSLSYFWSLPSGVCLWVETGLFPQLVFLNARPKYLQCREYNFANDVKRFR
jgi:hypothetical protein